MDDVEKLANALLDRILRNTGQPRKKISQEALRLLKSYSWPGNVRELENLVERAMARSSGEMLEPIDFPTQISARLNLSRLPSEEPLEPSRKVVPIAERHAILEAKGDKLLAVQMLGIGKTTLYRRLREYDRNGCLEATPDATPA